MKHILRTSIAAVACSLLALLGPAAQAGDSTPSQAQSYAEFVRALRPGRSAPVVAILAHAEGTETTDFLVPHALLRHAGITVVPVAPAAGPVELMPALKIRVDTDFAAFAARYPQGADYVIVPALHRTDDPQVLDWLRTQQQHGAILIGVCAGAQVLAAAGMLDGRSFTGHWWDRSYLSRQPGARHVPHQRYLADRGVVTTTGVSASLPATLALIEALQGPASAQALAASLAMESWGVEHNSSRFGLDISAVGTTVFNTLAFWRHETVGLPVREGSDDIALALVADAWSRTYRSQAVALAPGPVRLASGLLLLADPTDAVSWTQPLSEHPAPCQLDDTLLAIASRYGAATSRWVATQLEYAAPMAVPSACKRG